MANVVIIGGGAAGCFCAALLSELHPGWSISILEAGSKLMAKLSITGGGRCNLTNSFARLCPESSSDLKRISVKTLEQVYPRGASLMKRALGSFSQWDCCKWFESHGVELIVQEDQCVFPRSQDAMQIVQTLERQMRSGGVKVHCGSKVEAIGLESSATSRKTSLSVILSERSGSRIFPASLLHPDAIVLATGGGTAGILQNTGIELIPPVPSLFTFKIDDESLRSLMGTVVQDVTLGLAGTKFRSHGTLLLTDWGVSGPATLRLSSYAARHLAKSGYHGTLLIDWLGRGETHARDVLAKLGSSGRMIVNSHPDELTDRLWRHLVQRAKIREDCRWRELGSKGQSRLLSTLTSDTYSIVGRARFKDEFVTCGGVSLAGVNPETMESRRVPGLYFAGEVLDIDAVTGGFNLQAAWSTAWIAAHGIQASGGASDD